MRTFVLVSLLCPPWALAQIIVGPDRPLCPTAVAADCNDAAYPTTDCGARTLENALAGVGDCAAVCRRSQRRFPIAQCTDERWLSSICGQLEQVRWTEAAGAEVRGVSRCADATEGLRDPEDDEPDVVQTPGELFTADGVEIHAITDTETATREPYGRDRQSFAGGTSNYYGHRMRLMTRQSSASPAAEDCSEGPCPLTDFFERFAWEVNGNQVNSCTEYVYEKYYDYSRFEDAVAPLGSDYGAIFELAYAGFPRLVGDFYVYPPTPATAIGTKGFRGTPLRARDGTPIDPQIALPEEGLPRNTYLEAVQTPEEREFAIELNPELRHGRCGLHILKPTICDEDLYAATQDQVTPVKDWGWHHDVGTVLRQEYIDEVLYAYDAHKARYAQLLEARAKTMIRLIEAMRATVREDWPVELAVDFDLDALVNPPIASPASRTLVHQAQTTLARADLAAVGSLTISQPQFRIIPAPGRGGLSSLLDLVLGSLNGYRVEGSVARPGYARSDTLFGGLVGGNFIRRLTAELANHDRLIEAELQFGREIGCLDRTDFNPCDWSPKDFADAVLERYTEERELDYDNCLDNTSTVGFSGGDRQIAGRRFDYREGVDIKLPTVATDDEGRRAACWLEQNGELTPLSPISDTQAQVQGIVRRCFGDGANNPFNQLYCGLFSNRWTAGTHRLDLYFECLDAYKAAVWAALNRQVGSLTDEEGNLRIAGSSGDRTQVGNDLFHADLGFGTGWALGNFAQYTDQPDPDDLCALQPEAYVRFRAEAVALFLRAELVDASLHVRAGRDGSVFAAGGAPANPRALDRLEVRVLGGALPGLSASTDIDHEFDVIVDGDLGEGRTTFAQASATFAVGPVPVTVRGGLAGRVGIGHHIEGGRSGERCERSGVVGFVSPTAEIDAFASASVNAVVAEVGVKASLTLFRVDLPFDLALTLEATPNQGVQLTLGAGLDLVQSLLSGRISVFVETFFHDWDKTIFRWDGPKLTRNLFSVSFGAPIDVLHDVVRSLGLGG